MKFNELKISDKYQKYIGILFFAMLLIIFVSSSMTYKQQTIVPELHNKLLDSKPFYNLLNKIHINYDGVDESIHNIGYFKFVEFLLRKAAHFFSYLIIGGSFYLFSFNMVRNKLYLFFTSWFTVTGLAAFDEFHQQLTGGRTPLVIDVMLDSCGAFVGIGLVFLIMMIYLRRKQNTI